MISNELAEKILDYAMTRGGDYAEIFEEEREYTKIGIAGKETPTIWQGRKQVWEYEPKRNEKLLSDLFSSGGGSMRFSEDERGASSDWNESGT